MDSYGCNCTGDCDQGRNCPAPPLIEVDKVYAAALIAVALATAAAVITAAYFTFLY